MSYPVTSCGSSNHPSMPVRDSIRVASTRRAAAPSHRARSWDSCHCSRASASAKR